MERNIRINHITNEISKPVPMAVLTLLFSVSTRRMILVKTNKTPPTQHNLSRHILHMIHTLRLYIVERQFVDLPYLWAGVVVTGVGEHEPQPHSCEARRPRQQQQLRERRRRLERRPSRQRRARRRQQADLATLGTTSAHFENILEIKKKRDSNRNSISK